MSVGERIKRIIAINNRTIRDTSKKTYIPYKRLSAVLSGSRAMTVDEFSALCKAPEIDNYTIADMLKNG